MVVALRTLVDTSTKQYRDFVKNVIDVRSHSIHDPIKMNSPSLFKNPRYKTTFKRGKKIEMLQNNAAICGQLYILSVQKLEGDFADFLVHKIQSVPHSLSKFGKFHLPSTKSDLLGCLEPPGQPEPLLTHANKVMDGAVIVHCLSTSVSTSHAYADAIFIPYLENHIYIYRICPKSRGGFIISFNGDHVGWQGDFNVAVYSLIE